MDHEQDPPVPTPGADWTDEDMEVRPVRRVDPDEELARIIRALEL